VAPDPILRDIPEQIESRQLNIRPPRPGDGQMVFEAVRESLVDLRRFPASLPWALAEPSLEASEKFCREGYANFLARRDLPLLLFLKESGGMVGASGLHRLDWRVPKFELGFWGRSACRGRGLVTEGAGAILDFAFARLGARRVEALVDEANEPACRLCGRLGLSLEGTLRRERIDPDGVLRNTRVYAITR
jgi:RimJ/RimL family protein N-acetyltransferase